MSGKKGRLTSLSTNGVTSIISPQASSPSTSTSPNHKKSSLHQVQLPKIESPKVCRSTSDGAKDSKVTLQPLVPLTDLSPSKLAVQDSTSTIPPISTTSTIRLEPLLIHSPRSLSIEHQNQESPTHRAPNAPPPSLIIPEAIIDFSTQNGEVTIVYEMYNEKFPIHGGTISSDTINDLYGLNDIMPNCTLYLSKYSPTEIREMIIASSSTLSTLPLGSLGYSEWYCPYDSGSKIHRELQSDKKYYCYVSEDSPLKVEKKESTPLEKKTNEIERDDGRGFDCCTCIYGTPCQVRIQFLY